MMRPRIHRAFVALLLVTTGTIVHAECSLDHFIVGCNPDGIEGTADDFTLFVDCTQKYRNAGETDYAHWFYPLHESIFSSYGYRVGEPGFDAFQGDFPSLPTTYDPNRALAGEPAVDYGIIVECLSMSPGIRIVHKEYPQFTLADVNEGFSHSYIYALRGDSHMHLSYQAIDGESLHWVTFRLYDEIEDANQYEPSEPFTVVFNVAPPAGDLVVDGFVDVADLAALADSWLVPVSSLENDFCERADANRDGVVNLMDFALQAANWRTIPQDDGS